MTNSNNKCAFTKISTVYRYSRTCSNKECINKLVRSEDAKKKRISTCLNKYGVTNPAKSNTVKNKVCIKLVIICKFLLDM